MSVWQALLLGAVQGLTEFLPVSSSGHMLLLRRLMGTDAGMLFDVMMHVGTLLAVVVVFRRDIAALFRPPLKRLMLLAVATVPAGLAGVLLSGAIDEAFGDGRWLFATFAASGILVLMTRLIVRRRDVRGLSGGDTDLPRAVAMGVAQAAALLPGLSRSGTVIFAGTAAGGSTEDVVPFAFMMSVPVIIGSAVLGGAGMLDGGAGPVQTAVGCSAAFLTGIVSAKLTLKCAGKASSIPIAVYLFSLSMLSLVLELV